MEKSAEAFRTISEVSDLLDTPAHVLRFWESRFSQVKPVKRAGGRRYYRPADLSLLGGIKKLLHEDGMTIRGVQKILREQGVRHVASLTSVGIAPPAEAAAPVVEAPARVAAPRPSPFAGAAIGPGRHWPEAPEPQAAVAEDRLQPDPGNMADAGEEAPMEVDAPTLPLGLPGNVHPLQSGGQTATGVLPAASATARPPAAAMLRAMDTLRAREHRGELRAVYNRLSTLRDHLARRSQPARD